MGLIVEQCCCGCTLQTGTKIIGWLTLISGIINLILSATMMAANGGLAALAVFISIPGIVISVIGIAVSIPVLIAASKNRRPKLLLPWLVFNVLAILLGVSFGLYLSIAVILPSDLISGIIYIATILFSSALGVYFWLVIYSYFKQMREQIPITSEGKTYSKDYSSNDL